MITGKKEISIAPKNSNMSIFGSIANLPDLVKKWAWDGEFVINGQTVLELGLRCKSIEHKQGTNEFTLTFDEFDDFFATNTLTNVWQQGISFDFSTRIYDSALKKVTFSKTYKNCIITSIDEFDLSQTSSGKKQLNGKCKI